jgi:hypothetical protein
MTREQQLAEQHAQCLAGMSAPAESPPVAGLDWERIEAAFEETGSHFDLREWTADSGRQVGLGKFQGETVLTAYLYGLNYDDTAVLAEELRPTFGDLVPDSPLVWIHERDSGFVDLYSGTQSEYDEYCFERDAITCPECGELSTDVSDVTGACGACEETYERGTED